MVDTRRPKRGPRYLHYAEGRYFARKVVPAPLQRIVGRRELLKALGADRRQALDNLEEAVVLFKRILKVATERLAAEKAMPTPEELAQLHLEDRLRSDELGRDISPAWASIDINPDYVAAVRRCISGAATNMQMLALLGAVWADLLQRRLTTVKLGTPEWRAQMRLLARAEYAALEVCCERDEGHYRTDPIQLFPEAAKAKAAADRSPVAEIDPVAAAVVAPTAKPVSLLQLFRHHLGVLKRAGRGREIERRWSPVFDDLIAFLRHDDVNRMTKQDLVRWRDHLMVRPARPLAAKTVRDVYVAAVKAVMKTAHGDDLIKENVAATLTVKAPKAVRTREKGYTLAEAKAVLQDACAYRSRPNEAGRVREDARMQAAKRWIPWLCAHTGARVAEICQLRKSDVREQDGLAFIRITPEAGGTKTGLFRDVPLHAELIDVGFLAFVEASPAGALFTPATTSATTALRHAKTVAGRISGWVSSLGLAPGVAPSHGWRHRFKTVAREVGCDPRVTDAIQGHAARTAADDYGDLTLVAKKNAIDKMPRYGVKWVKHDDLACDGARGCLSDA